MTNLLQGSEDMSIVDVDSMQQKPKQDWENLVDSSSVTVTVAEPTQEETNAY